jgi:hypothetical protein
MPRGTPIPSKREHELTKEHHEYLKMLIANRKKEAIEKEIIDMIHSLKIVHDAIEDIDSDEELEEHDYKELYKHLLNDDSDDESEDGYIGSDYEVEERPRPPPRERTRPKPKERQRKPPPTPRARQKAIKMPSSIKNSKLTPRQRVMKEEDITIPKSSKKPLPKAKYINYKGIDHKFTEHSLGLGFKGARQLKEQFKLKEFIKDRMDEEELKKTKKKRGRPKKVKPERSLRERKESEEAFEPKKDSYRKRIDRYITNQYKNGMIIESKDPSVHTRIVEYCLKKKPKKMSAKLVSEAFTQAIRGTPLRDSKGFGL